MARALSDFRIENDRVVLLSFADGQNFRVSPKDLHRFLVDTDRLKVEEALQLRKQFIKRVLPPTLMSILVAAVIGVGGYDAYRMSHMIDDEQTQQQESLLQTKQEPSKSESATPTVTAHTTATPAVESAPTPVTTPAQPTRVATQPAATAPAASTSAPVAAPVVGPVVTTVTQPLTPVTDTVKKVTDPLLRSLLPLK